MIICCSFFHTQFSTRIHPRFDLSHQCRPNANIEKPDLVPKGMQNKLLIPGLANQEAKWDFARISMRPNSGRFIYNKAGLNVHATMCASSLFNLGTAIVLPLYILMIIAPQHKLTKKTMESRAPYVALSLLYAHVLVRSWTPQHLGALFGGSNMMPDFRRAGVLFFSQLSAAAAWIHLLLMDLFATRWDSGATDLIGLGGSAPGCSGLLTSIFLILVTCLICAGMCF
uniref:Uncharacterized protein n=1 Tax=Kalanchoe fedtschenkoi TaxID=63787 RepID=A0A7N0UBW5_KALFE